MPRTPGSGNAAWRFQISVQARAARVPQVRGAEKEWRTLRQSRHAQSQRLPVPWGQDAGRSPSPPAKDAPSPL